MNDLVSRVHDDVSRQRSSSYKALLAGISAAALLALAACSSGSSGSSSATSSTSPSSAAAAGSSSSVLSQSKALLSEAAATAVTGPSFGTVPVNQIVPWTAAMMPTPSKLATGKQISVDVVYSIPEGYTPYAAHVIQAVGAKIGWKVKVIEATAPTQPADLTAMQQAVLDKPTAIIALVIPATYVAPAL